MSVEVALLALAVGVAVGIVSALFGIGGGTVMVPFMVLILEKSQHIAEGTSLLVIVPTALAGVYAHRKARYVTWRTFAALGAAGAVGAVIGARIALVIDGPVLQKLFAVFVAAVGIRLLFEGRAASKAESDDSGTDQ